MQIADYPRPAYNTGIGFHAGANGAFPLGEYESGWQEWVDRIKGMGGSWLKVLAFGTSALGLCRFLLDRDIMPVVRLYRPAPNPGCMVDDDPGGRDAVAQYVAAGVRYFEVNNEPNLFDEWAGEKNAEGIPHTWQDCNPRQPDLVADSWVKDASFVIAQGGLPGIPAMAPGGNIDDQDFLNRFFARIVATGNAGIMERGAWLSVHPAGFDHPLQYPDDEVNQKGAPLQPCEFGAHQWRFGTEAEVNAERVKGRNAGQTIMDPGASNGWRKWEMVGNLFHQWFRFRVPALATEGGFWIGEGQDPRYHILTEWDQSALTRTVCEAMMRGDYPDWFFCTGFWLLAGKGMGASDMFERQAWYSLRAGESGQWPVVGNLTEMPKQARVPYAPIVPPVVPPAPTVLSDMSIAMICHSAGFRGSGLTTAVAVVLAESGGNPLAVNEQGNTPPSRDRGLFQINDFWHPEVTDAQAFDPTQNAKAAFVISEQGTNFNAWTSVLTGAYLAYWGRALAVTQDTGPTVEQIAADAYSDAPALAKYAAAHGLGPGITGERDFILGGKLQRGQMFATPAGATWVYCKVGDWGNIRTQKV